MLPISSPTFCDFSYGEELFRFTDDGFRHRENPIPNMNGTKAYWTRTRAPGVGFYPVQYIVYENFPVGNYPDNRFSKNNYNAAELVRCVAGLRK